MDIKEGMCWSCELSHGRVWTSYKFQYTDFHLLAHKTWMGVAYGSVGNKHVEPESVGSKSGV